MENQVEQCERVLEHLSEAVDGELRDECAAHVDACDACRDLVHDARCAIAWVGRAPDGFVAPLDLEARILAAIDARELAAANKVAAVVVPLAKAPHVSVAQNESFLTKRAYVALAAAAALAGIGVWRGSTSVEVAPTSPWKGALADVTGSDSVTLIDAIGTERTARKGDPIGAGAKVRTDMKTRARVALDDGSSIVVDRGSEVALVGASSRTASLNRGTAIFDVAPSDGDSTVQVAKNAVSSKGAKIAISLADESVASVSIARGVVSARGAGGTIERLKAGEGALVSQSGTRVMGEGGLSQAFGWAEEDGAERGDDAVVAGLGELRARQPGDKGEGGKPLKLAKQNVKVRIAGEIARTEVEEVFASDEPLVLEGIFRFPLPPDAQIERLALDVDGKLEEGAFVERDKGKAIWRGVIFNATAKPEHRPREEWIWVPGPWRDPALLEWRAGGRMELRIFPIPAKGSRRLVLAYTQRIAPTAGLRRYVYPLPRLGDGRVAVDDFAIDVRVLGHDPSRGVRVRGYESEAVGGEGDGVHRAFARKQFAPSGDLVVEYAKKQEGVAKSYAYQSKGLESAPSYVALSIAPELPRVVNDVARTQVLIVDSSRSMVGERYARASALAAKFVDELDPRDRFVVLACDIKCVPNAMSPAVPSKAAGDGVRSFLAARTPDGASNLAGAIETARKFTNGERIRLTYIGDGAPTIGVRDPTALESSVRNTLGDDAQLTAVAVGVDSDLTSLGAIAAGGGGTVVPYQAGQPLAQAALDVLEATYGTALRDVKLELPPGLIEVAPSRIGSMRAGQEIMVVARTTLKETTGQGTLRGRLAGKPWSTSFPIVVRPSPDEGNAFVPRLFAAATIADMERAGSDANKSKIVDLSKEFSVPSKHTSLIVLESPAMAAAFGVERTARASQWSGEHEAISEAAGTPKGDSLGERSSVDPALGAGQMGFAAPMASVASARGEAATTSLPPINADPELHNVPLDLRRMPRAPFSGRRPSGEWRRMRREWYRSVTFADAATLPRDLETKIATARGQVLASPDSRDRVAALFGLVSQRSSLSEAKDVLAAWTKRDPLDVDAIARRADLIAREGERAEALRIQTGVLESNPDNAPLAHSLGQAASLLGDRQLAEALFAVRDGAKRADAGARRPETMVLDGAWDAAQPTDVDFAAISPLGLRLSWLSGKEPVDVKDGTSTTHERLTLEAATLGTYLIEATGSGTNASGSLKVTAHNQTRAFPFRLNGQNDRVVVGRVTIEMKSRLVPDDEW